MRWCEPDSLELEREPSLSLRYFFKEKTGPNYQRSSSQSGFRVFSLSPSLLLKFLTGQSLILWEPQFKPSLKRFKRVLPEPQNFVKVSLSQLLIGLSLFLARAFEPELRSTSSSSKFLRTQHGLILCIKVSEGGDAIYSRT